jgi:hypothetical protein
VDHYAYSVPHAFVKEKVDVRITAHIVEVFHVGQRIASHERQIKPGAITVRASTPFACLSQQWTEKTALS